MTPWATDCGPQTSPPCRGVARQPDRLPGDEVASASEVFNHARAPSLEISTGDRGASLTPSSTSTFGTSPLRPLAASAKIRESVGGGHCAGSFPVLAALDRGEGAEGPCDDEPVALNLEVGQFAFRETDPGEFFAAELDEAVGPAIARQIEVVFGGLRGFGLVHVVHDHRAGDLDEVSPPGPRHDAASGGLRRGHRRGEQEHPGKRARCQCTGRPDTRSPGHRPTVSQVGPDLWQGIADVTTPGAVVAQARRKADHGRVTSTGTQTISVLMTDLVGSTAIADRIGPEAADALRIEHLGLLRGALERTSGREVKNLGDGLMVVFDSAARSLACAVEMQQAVETRNRRAEEQLGLRIGVSVGDATVEEGDYFGEPVVESASLCAHASGGQIVVNALVRQISASRDGHSFRSLGPLELKGISQPVEAFELEWEPAPVGGIALPERLRELPASAYVGRAAERARLSELWGQACEGSLRFALISGEAGVGKTRSATDLALEVRAQGATVLYGRCDEDLGVPYQPWAQALGYLVGEAPQPILDAHVERYGGDLARLIGALGDRVAELPAPRQSDPETERYLLYAAAAGLLEGAAEQEPLLLVLDDLHWADSPTLSLLRHVVTAGVGMPVMVVGTYRDSDLSPDHPLTALLADLHREQGVERIRLRGLQAADVLALMDAAAGYELDDAWHALALEITRETAGNPFFAGELLRHLTESGAIVEGQDGRWHLMGEVAELGLPQSVREVIGRRVQRLGPDGRTALSAAAVIGRDFDLDLLLAVADIPETHLLDLLEEAVAASLLQENRDRAGRFTFTHALVEHTLYEDLGPNPPRTPAQADRRGPRGAVRGGSGRAPRRARRPLGRGGGQQRHGEGDPLRTARRGARARPARPG